MSVRRGKRRDPKTGAVREYWMVDVDIEHPDGTRERVRKVSPVQTRRGAEQYERELRDAVVQRSRRGKEVRYVKTVSQFAQEFLQTYVAVNNKPSEAKTKQIILDQHVVPRLGRLRLDEVGERLEPFKAALLDTGLSRKRVNNILAVVSKMLRYAEERGLLDRVPKLRLLKLPPTSHDFFTFDEYAGLIQAAAAEPFWNVAVLLGGDAGLRIGEIIELRWADLDFASENIAVRRSSWEGIVGTTKGGRERIVPMTRRLKGAVEKIRHSRSTLVLCNGDGTPVTADAAKRPLWKVCERAGLRRVGWHVLRHTFCSHLAMRGAAPAAIQTLAGHQSPSTTNRYMHLAPVMLRETVRLLDLTGQHGTDGNETENRDVHGNLTATVRQPDKKNAESSSEVAERTLH